ncbi:MAG TPA: aminotransferase class I/II-fold pyridoxal phosphate-dependent enzyme [Myxococcaceae bacterium]|nr:aminotransferase class I/II-fold pyridoxal phosphate-dependent enzyme [Myxococcaceae bacterium]
MTLPNSPKEAHARLEALSRRLADAETREEALVELRALAEAAKSAPVGAPLRTVTVRVAMGTAQEELHLLLLPSIFSPEAWAQTFLEGLLRVPLEEYEGRSLVEIGAGSGWICIALARFTGLQRILGTDLNPQAPAVAWCNAWLNGDEALVSRLSFAVSDLLDDVPQRQFDFVAGCIPQVLRSEGLPSLVSGDDDPALLLDLSNYCAVQNVYEDHFGLGLIARLLDEVPERLNPGGRLLLNLAGRPGRAIIERMFRRRGFSTRVRITRRVKQASDTDIRPLVELEARTGRAFEFFMDAHSAEPLPAATSHGWLAAGHPIWHEVSVWDAHLTWPRPTLALRAALDRLGLRHLNADLDLGATSEEQLGFVAQLAERMADDGRLPYAHEAGDVDFRETVVRYLARYFGLNLAPGSVFVAPERTVAVHTLLLATCDPGDSVLISRSLLPVYEEALNKANVQRTLVHDTLAEIRELITAFTPKVVLLSIPPAERTNLSSLRHIVADAAKRGILVVVDESEHFRITGEVESRTLFEFLARNEEGREHLVVLYGLIKNVVYPDLALSLMLPVPPTLAADLEVAAETTYSRVSTLAQHFYARTFAELLSVRLSFGAPWEPPPVNARPVELPRSARIVEAHTSPAFAPKIFREDDPRLVRLDYGENEVALPPPLVEGLLASALVPPGAQVETGLCGAVAAFLLETRGVRYDASEIVPAAGVWPLMHDLALVLSRQLGRPARVWLVTPAYGMLAPTWRFAGCEVLQGTLGELLQRDGGVDAVVISQPANPAGRYLRHRELVSLAAWVVEHRAWLISDEIFGLLNLTNLTAETVKSPVGLELAVPGIGERTLLLGGVAKEYAAGGLRVGWMASRDPALLEAMRAVCLAPLPRIAAQAAAWVYAAHARGRDGELLHPERHHALISWLSELRRSLEQKRRRLSAVLPSGEPEEGELGGLFVAPNVEGWLGRQLDGEHLTVENLPAKIYEATGVVLNGGDWIGDRSRVRAVFSLPDATLDRAVEALAALKRRIED